MGDIAEQNTGENVPPQQQSNPMIVIRPQIREKVVQNIINTLRSRCKQQHFRVGVESIARKFEEKVCSVASDEKDYIRRIAMKMKTLDAIPMSGGPSQLNPASSGDVQSQSIKLNQQQAQSQIPSQLQPRQMISENNNFTSQSSNLVNIPRIPPNIEKNAPEQLAIVKDSISQPQLQQHQNIHVQLPNSQQVISKVAVGPTIKSEQTKVSSAYRHQSVTKEQYESWQRDNAHLRKSVPPQQKLIPVKHEVQSNTINNQQNISQPIRAHPQNSMAESTAHHEELKRQNVQSHVVPLVQSYAQRISQQKVNVVREESKRQNSKAENTGHHEELKRQNVQSHVVPLLQSHAQQISHQKADLAREETKHSSGVSSVSQNLLRPDTGTFQSKNLPSEASMRIDTSSAVERHKDTDGWREGIHQRIMDMKKKYLTGMVGINALIDEKFKHLDTHPNVQNKDVLLKKLKEAKMMVLRIYKFLNLPKEEIMPVHGEKLQLWEHNIVTYFSKFRPKAPVPQPLQPLPPQTHSPKVTDNTSRSTLQKNVTSLSSVPPVSRNAGDNSQAQTQPPTSNLNLPIHVDPTNVGENQSPIERLLKAVSSVSPQALKSGMDDIFAVTRMDDVMESSAPWSTSKGGLQGLGQDLGAVTGCRLQARNVSLLDGGTETRTWTTRPWLISSIPSDPCNARDTFDTESTSGNDLKRRRIDPIAWLSEEIRKVNHRLIDIVVEICKEDENDVIGMVVKCRYVGVSVNKGFMKSIVPSGNSSLIHPLHLLIPTEYPDCSPTVLDKLTSESNDVSEDLSYKARARLDIKLRGLDSPYSISEVARKWEICARDVVIEYVEKFGGGTFSSRYGTWENCLNIA